MLTPGSLWPLLQKSTVAATHSGALFSIPSECQVVTQDGFGFLVRIAGNLLRKEQQRALQQKANTTGDNPFLPYDPQMFVADLSPTHVALLNKFNVVSHHLLMVTREFEEQDNLLNTNDFQALWLCLKEYDGLAFYNGGLLAGASQRHKHLQLVPLPLFHQGSRVPLEIAFADPPRDCVTLAPCLPFMHALVRFADTAIASVDQLAEQSLVHYHKLLTEVGLSARGPKHSGPYNLLVTREWMLLVPRVEEFYRGMSLNSLAFAGALLAKNQQQLEIIKQGPMQALCHVAGKRTD